MSKKIAFIFPGQGAQYPGMGRDFYEKYDEAKEVFDSADAILGMKFSDLIFGGPKDELTLTKNSQLAIFISSIAILRVVQTHYPDLKPSFCAGLSLGEYTALVASEMMTFESALLLVKARGNYMHEACMARPGTMSVVLGMGPEAVKEHTKDLDGVWIANLNCPGQIVISGTKEGIEKAGTVLKAGGAKRVLPLDVSGAFHSGLMQEAQDRLAPMIQETPMVSSSTSIVMNATGASEEDLDQVRKAMTHQVTYPVLWEKCILAMASQGIDCFIEMGPGKTLSGLNKRIGVSAPTISIEKVEDLQGVKDHA